MKTLTFVLLGILLCATAGYAQVVVNPTKVEYTASADHGQLTKYVIGYFINATTLAPVQSYDLPIVTPDVNGKIEQPLQALQSIPVGMPYIAKIRAMANEYGSEWSAPSNEFARTPLPPGSPLVKK